MFGPQGTPSYIAVMAGNTAVTSHGRDRGPECGAAVGGAAGAGTRCDAPSAGHGSPRYPGQRSWEPVPSVCDWSRPERVGRDAGNTPLGSHAAGGPSAADRALPPYWCGGWPRTAFRCCLPCHW